MISKISVAAALMVVGSTPLFARGGGPNVMDSPGYQRRLQESRQQLGTQSAPVQPVTRHNKKHKNRH